MHILLLLRLLNPPITITFFIDLNIRYWYMNWTRKFCNYCVKVVKLFVIKKWILFFSLLFRNGAGTTKYYIDECHVLWTNVFFLEINVKCNCDILSIYAVTFFPYNNKSQIEKKNSIIIQKLSLIKIQTPLLSLHTCPANSCSFPESHTFNVLLLFSALSLPTNSRG